MNPLYKYDPYGPFNILQDKAFIKSHYVPYEIGTLELQQIISNKMNQLTEELSAWTTLNHENERILNGEAQNSNH